MNIEIYGRGERMQYLSKMAAGLYSGHLLFLPIPTSRDGEFITDTDIRISEAIIGVGEKSVVVGYDIPMKYKDELALRGAFVLDLMFDEEFLRENARVTAIGALGYILTNEKREPANLNISLIGYGRIGSELLEMLLFLGASVTVYSRGEKTREFLAKSGVMTSDAIYNGGNIDSDILINTAPCDFSHLLREGKISSATKIIELASGDNFGGAKEVVRLPSLPSKMYPESAALIYRDAVRRFIERTLST